ncbi:filamentous hemagglutinin outer membrane protein [Nostoc carneum NIES-2107]|nr:filamentous hemagglutinin outer membrane protein [Nostoc carneum NIES-2107]
MNIYKNTFLVCRYSAVNIATLARLLTFLGGLAMLSIALPHTSALAQITPDETLGAERSVITPNVNIKGATADQIEGGAIRGSNLFHSFSEFNIQDGQRVYFANPGGINNILSRVTGNNPSNILGTLGVNGSANLFLINPNGIIFGQNARLDLGGSFVGSTANAIKFGDSTKFSATASQTKPLLTITAPIGLQFAGNTGSIQVQGDGQGQRSTSELIDTNTALRVQPNQTLALVGGNLTLEGGTLKTGGGRIELGSVAGSGIVSLTSIDSGFALGYSDVPTFGDIQLSGGAVVDASGAGGGDIQVQGRRLTLRDGSQIEASTLGAGAGGTLNVTTSESIELIGATPDGESFSALFTKVYQGATGAGGNLTVKTEQLSFRDGLISTSVEEGAIGNGGNLTVETGQLIVRDGGQIQANTFGEGNAGNLTVSAREFVELLGRTADDQFSSALLTSSEDGATGDGGNLTVETGRLILRDGSQIGAGTLGNGNGGSLKVLARESVELIGDFSGLFTSVNPNALGNGGDLTVETGRLILRDRALISSATNGEGNAGNLKVSARESVELMGDFSGLLTSVNPGATGNGGNLTVETKQLIVRDGARILTGMFGEGEAGSLTVSARSVELDNQASINTIATTGNGGNITLQLQDLLLLRRNSQISATAGTAQQNGNGGNITINAPKGFIVAAPNENSDITANAFQGSGGKVNINAAGIFGIQPRSRQELEGLLQTTDPTKLDSNQLPTNDITAISQTNPLLNGEINLNTPDTDPSKGVEELPLNIVDVSGLINQNLCVAAQGSEFIMTGRGGLPPSPYDTISANTAWEDWSILPQTSTQATTANSSPQQPTASTKIVEAQGLVKDVNGNVVLTAQPVAVTPKGTWLHPQDCQMLRGNS